MSMDAPGPAKLLLAAVYEYLDEHYPYWRVSQLSLPDGIRMEMHPSVRNRLWQDDYALDWPPRDWGPVFGVPVKITTDLPEGYWRLVVVTEDVLTGGKL